MVAISAYKDLRPDVALKDTFRSFVIFEIVVRQLQVDMYHKLRLGMINMFVCLSIQVILYCQHVLGSLYRSTDMIFCRYRFECKSVCTWDRAHNFNIINAKLTA